ncbi:MAG: lactonase family protein [Micrococcales bacterium]|nr:lactonase family protein [Micrococcales bacterium]
MTEISLLVGTYTEPILHGTGDVLVGRGEGIYALAVDAATGRFGPPSVVARTRNPSFLAVCAGKIYAVNELKEFDGAAQGSVSAFDADGRSLGTWPTGGTDPCHVAVSRDGRLLVVANFMSGSIRAYPVAAAGALRSPGQFFAYAGHGHDPARQAGPHAHAATFDAAGRFVYVPDLGLDQMHVYAYTADPPSLADEVTCPVAPGSGPRYAEFHPSNGLLYVTNELSCTVDAFAVDPATGRLTLLDTVSTLPDGCTTASLGAALRAAPDGGHLYASNRGHDSIAVLAVCAGGRLTRTAVVPSGGRTPRDFTIDPSGRFLVVAHQDSDNLVCFAIGADGGLEPRDEVELPTPVCVICRDSA